MLPDDSLQDQQVSYGLNQYPSRVFFPLILSNSIHIHEHRPAVIARHTLDQRPPQQPRTLLGDAPAMGFRVRLIQLRRQPGPRVLDAATPLGDRNHTPQRSDTADDDTRPST